MGTRERRERERSQQRGRILDAALEIITSEGYAGLSMRKLAERIEYSAASIYLYFKSREQIAQELSERGFAELLDAVVKATSGKAGAEALSALGRAYVAFGVAHPEMYRLIFMGDSEYMTAAYADKKPDSAAAKAYGVLFEIARQLKEGAKTGKKTDPTAIAESILCMLHGIVSLHIGCKGFLTSSPEALLRVTTGTWMAGLKCAPAEAGGPGSLGKTPRPKQIPARSPPSSR